MSEAAGVSDDDLLRRIRAARRAGNPAEVLALQAQAAHPARADLRLERAYALLDLGRFAEAAPLFDALAAEVPAATPAHVEVLIGQGRVRRRGGDLAAALALFEAALAIDPRHLGARLDAAQAQFDLGRNEAAAAGFAAIAADHPQQMAALLGLGRLARRRGRLEEALAWFQRALAAQPAHAAARLDTAYALLDTGATAEAEALFRAVPDNAPQHVAALLGLARIARQRGERAATRALLDAAVAADPGHVGARLELAADLREWGDYDAARAAVEAVLQAQPGHPEALVQRGLLQRLTGAFAEALATFAAAAAQHPSLPRPLLEAAQTARALGQPAEATAWLQRALALAPDDIEALGQRADLAWLAEDYPGCLALCEQALAGRPVRPWPYVLASRALVALGRREEALALLDRADAERIAVSDIVAARIEIHKRAGEWPAVRAALAAAGEVVAGNFRLWVEQVQLDIAHGDFAAVGRALATPPAASVRDLARVALLRGHVESARWRLAAAQAEYREAVRLAPLDPGTINELARVCMLRMELDEAGQLNARSVRLEGAAAKLRGRAPRPAQSHLGQVLDEFRMDRAAAERLAALLRLPPGERVGRLRALMAQNPGHTPTAIQLVVALREAGAFDALHPPVPHAASLPRRIVQFWDAPEPPQDVAALMQGWRSANPHWEYVRFDAPRAFAFLRAHYGPAVAAAFRRAHHPASQADLFRLCYLHLYGGLYVDADDRCLGPLEALAPPGVGFLSWQESYSTLANNLLGAAPGHPVIRRALGEAVAALNRRDSDSLWLSTGPGLITRAFAAELAETPLRPAEWLRGVRVLAQSELPHTVAVHCFALYKTTEKHWNRHEFGGKGQAPPAA